MRRVNSEIVQMQPLENTGGDMAPLKTFMKLSVILVRKNCKEIIDSCSITKASNNSHFHSYFSRSFFLANISDFIYSLSLLALKKS